MTSEEARHRAHLSWSRTGDRAARTAAARRSLDARFEREARKALGDQATERQVADAAQSLRRAWFIEFAAAGRKAQAS